MVEIADFERVMGIDKRPFTISCDRRALMVGASGTVAAMALLAGCARSPETTLDMRQLETIGKLCDLLIPRTDTPGAVDAGCVTSAAKRGNAMPVDQQHCFKTGLDEIGLLFANSPEANWKRIAAAAKGQQAAAVLDTLRSWILLDFYTSEPGATQELRYEPVPGRYDPDVRVTADTRAYSSDWIGVSLGGRQ